MLGRILGRMLGLILGRMLGLIRSPMLPAHALPADLPWAHTVVAGQVN